MITMTVTPANAVQVADKVNEFFEGGGVTLVNGRELVSRFGQPVARAWQNGTVSVKVKGRTKGKIADLYIKVGEVLHAV